MPTTTPPVVFTGRSITQLYDSRITVTEQEIRDASILIVDDQEVDVALLESMLRQEGYHDIRSLTDSRLVDEAFLEFQPDILLLDIHMPHIDGIGVIDNLVKLPGGDILPIIVITDEGERPVRHQALEAGARDFLEKPLDPSEATARIRNILEARLLHDRLLKHDETVDERVKERIRELQESQLEVITRLMSAAEHRDDVTGGHITRMSLITKALAPHCGMNEEETQLLFHSACMHDIGKIGVPDEVLNKPGPLDEEEWGVMRQHPQFGAEILANGGSPLLRMAERVALYHHEKWDGTGYPKGLSGEDIPLEARVCAVADVLDALISRRPYKEPWPLDEALDQIRANAGSHFDPAVVEQLDKIKDSITEVYEDQNLFKT
jgi:putative two-component system response regulator